MRILELTLENIKRFDTRTVAFAPGVNFISGKNGAGKTTLVEAIGLCLFNAGARGGSTGYFLRDGAKSGSIAVRFLADGAEYTMRRKLKAGSMPRRLFDAAGEELDLHGDPDIDAYLREILHLPGDQSLSELFHEIIGVRQGMLTQPFLEQPQERRQVFERMLGVERYREAMKHAAGMPSYFLDRVSQHTMRIEVCRSHTEDLEATRAACIAAEAALEERLRAAAEAERAQAAAIEARAAQAEELQAIELEGKAIAALRARHDAEARANEQSRTANAAARADLTAREAEGRKLRAAAEAALAEAEQTEAAACAARKALAEAIKAQKQARADALAEKTHRHARWEARLQELRDTAKRAGGGTCPFLNIPCTSVDSLEDAIETRIEKNESAIAALGAEIASLRAAHAAAEQAEQAALSAHTEAETAAAKRHADALQEFARVRFGQEALEKEKTQRDTEAKALAEAEARLAEAHAALLAREARHRAAEAEAAPLEEAEARLRALSHALGEAKASAEAAKKEAARLRDSLAEKEDYAAERIREEAAREDVLAVQSLYNGLAAMLKNAGERMAAAYRERLSALATAHYRSISQDTARLQWLPDYELSLADQHLGAPRLRSFRQLSGGEQMSAALALRLALLTELAPLGLAFFDEPTANLDQGRRAQLAALLPKVTRGFEQVFVISHDDTFDSIGEQIIAL